MNVRVLGFTCCAAAWLGRGVQAQSATPAGRPRLEGASFALLQAASTGSVALYGAREIGPAMAMLGVVSTPRTGYRAVVAGVGTRLRLGTSSGAIVAAALAQGTNGRSARLYLLPSVTAGPVIVSATATLYQPLEGSGAREGALNPFTLTVRTGPLVSAGIALVCRAAAGQPSRGGLGPAAQLKTPVGVFSAQFLAVGLPRPEVRGSYRMLF